LRPADLAVCALAAGSFATAAALFATFLFVL